MNKRKIKGKNKPATIHDHQQAVKDSLEKLIVNATVLAEEIDEALSVEPAPAKQKPDSKRAPKRPANSKKAKGRPTARRTKRNKPTTTVKNASSKTTKAPETGDLTSKAHSHDHTDEGAVTSVGIKLNEVFERLLNHDPQKTKKFGFVLRFGAIADSLNSILTFVGALIFVMLIAVYFLFGWAPTTFIPRKTKEVFCPMFSTMADGTNTPFFNIIYQTLDCKDQLSGDHALSETEEE